MRMLPTLLLLAACSDKGEDSSVPVDPVRYDRDGDGFYEDEDCDDDSSAISPAADETCNGVDDDCDDVIDDDPTNGTTFWPDADEDGYGSASDPMVACTNPKGFVPNDLDCDDTDDDIRPGAPEQCNDIDDDCDQSVDDNPSDAPAWYADDDGDLHGSGTGTLACEPIEGLVDSGDDCDDADASVYPKAPEVCRDGKVNDCGSTLEAAASVCPPIWPSDVTGADARLLGADTNGRAGASVSATGDVDGDGLADLLVGAPTSQSVATNEGAAFLVLGGVTGNIDLATGAAATIRHASGSSLLGSSVAIVDDTNGDGLDDLLLGAPGMGSLNGSAHLYLGPVTGALSSADADTTMIGDASGDALGASVAGVGDADGDGFSDVVLGAPAYGSAAGSVYLFLGPVSSGTLTLGADADAVITGNTNTEAGRSVAGAGDTNGDGIHDFLVGAPHGLNGILDTGVTYLVLGGKDPVDLSLEGGADLTIRGMLSEQAFGWSVAGAGDTDGDGLDDLVGGSPLHPPGGTNQGAAFVFLGGVTGTIDLSAAELEVTGDVDDQQFGIAVSGAGDVSGDGLDDILMGAHAADSTIAGHAYLVLGGSSGSTSAKALLAVSGEGLGDETGASLSGGHDTDGDGVPDSLIGAPGAVDGTETRGAAYLILNERGY